MIRLFSASSFFFFRLGAAAFAMTTSLILDNDAGLDDAWEIFFLHKFLPSSVQILALTAVSGNTEVEHVCANDQRILAELGRPDVPVFRGASDSLIPSLRSEYFYGKNGFGDAPLPYIDLPKIQEENAVVAMHRLSKQYQGNITLVCSGPLTNVALAIRTYDDFVDNVKEIYVMGGNYKGRGNVKSSAEFNFYTDPEAAEIVLRALAGKIILLPWETCVESSVPFEWRDELVRSGGPMTQLLGRLESPIVEKMKSRRAFTGYVSADTLLGAIVAKPELVTEESHAHATVELAGFHTRGQVVIDHRGDSKPNVKIITSIDVEGLKLMLKSLYLH